MGAAFAVQLLVTILFMPESAYHRTHAINIDTGGHNVEIEDEKEISEKVEHAEVRVHNPGHSDEPKKSYVRELLPYDGYWGRVDLWRTVILPFTLLGSPMVAWATLLFTTCISWLVLISITLSQIFSAPPYSFSVAAVGATNVSSFVATLLGTVIAGPVIDGLAKRMSTMNRGTFGTLPPSPPGPISPPLSQPILTLILCRI
jgi:hypothetical protein